MRLWKQDRWATWCLMWAGLCLVVGLGSLLAGCNIVGPLGSIIAGDEKTPALYALPENRSVVVFIDDRGSRLPSRAVRQKIGHTAERTLLDGGAVPEADVISSDSILRLASAEQFEHPTSIAAMGHDVGAQMVVYATVDSFGLSPDGQQFAPSCTLRVKVVDTKDGARLWPKSPQEWYTLEVKPPIRQGSSPTSMSERTQAEEDLAEVVGRRLGQMFVKHVRYEHSQRVGS